ncbi:MAG TPA: hypothetical protein PLB46_15195 [Chitinophagales bacterium]|nr:hypothetical protein [Chitinophagales bacterium]
MNQSALVMEEKSNEHYLDDLKEIRSMMEKSSRFISLSGLSGISAGIIALVGAFIASWYIKTHIENPSYTLQTVVMVQMEDVLFLLLDAGIVLFLALTSATYFAVRKARMQNLPVWSKAGELTLINLLIPLATGAIFCLILYSYNIFILIAPATLLFYGLALLNASKYTLAEVRYLGICEIVLGLAGMIIPGYSIILWAIGFGLLHIIYGAVMYYRYER